MGQKRKFARGYLEGVTILSDDGFGIALFVPDREGIAISGSSSMISTWHIFAYS